jgi:hypothetical protein
MMTHIKMIHWALDVAERNLEEAAKYAKKAHGLKMQYRPAADWCVEMAKMHLSFNEKAAIMLDQLCKELHEAGGNTELWQSMRAAVHEKREKLAEETAEVKMMLEMYNK